jgi:hypothetical protein
MPAVFSAAIAWEAWETIEPLQHQHWLGNLLVAALLRQTGKIGSHLFCLNAGLRIVPRERRKSPLRTTRLLAVLDAFADAASAGLSRDSTGWRWPKARWNAGSGTGAKARACRR